MNEFQFSSRLADVRSPGTENNTNESFCVGYRQISLLPPGHKKKANNFLILRVT